MFIAHVIKDFFVAFGIVVGGSLLGGIGAMLTKQAPLNEMWELATQLKIWGLVGALGGTFDSFLKIEEVIVDGHLSPVVKQGILVLTAFAGAHSGTKFIHWLIGWEGS